MQSKKFGLMLFHLTLDNSWAVTSKNIGALSQCGPGPMVPCPPNIFIKSGWMDF